MAALGVGLEFLDLGRFRREADRGSAAMVVPLGVAVVAIAIRVGLYIAACHSGIAVMMMFGYGVQAGLHRSPATGRRPDGAPSQSGQWRRWCCDRGFIHLEYVHLSCRPPSSWNRR